jgi:hypothetical protein
VATVVGVEYCTAYVLRNGTMSATAKTDKTKAGISAVTPIAIHVFFMSLPLHPAFRNRHSYANKHFRHGGSSTSPPRGGKTGLTGISSQGLPNRDNYPCEYIPVSVGSIISRCSKIDMKSILALVIMLILADASLTYVAVGHLGAYEAVLIFINRMPSTMWLVAFMKILGVLYIYTKTRKYGWVKYGILVILISHLLAVINNVYWLLWRLSLL